MTAVRTRDAGDSALLLELTPAIDPRVNAHAIAIAAALKRDGLAGVRDVVSTYRTVAVYFDPLATDVAVVRAAMERACAQPVAPVEGVTVEVPVWYGGAEGPDLDAVASFAGTSAATVVERHAGIDYRVFMLGFLPGFAYMGLVDPTIAAPRHGTPRLKIPPGSVGIAGSQTGVYPFESPGGWQIIGKTPLRVFDANRVSPSLFAPGDRVRFVATSHMEMKPEAPTPVVSTALPDGTRHEGSFITVLRPGLLTTIQDAGRWGHQSSGVPVSGAMDLDAHRLANALVGNITDCATLEVTLAGPELRLEADVTMAIGGADLGATIDGAAVPRLAAVPCRAGNVIRFGERRSGGRAYVAFAGGIAVPRVLGSRATHTRTGFGGIDGRALRTGDRLPLGSPSSGWIARRVDVPALHHGGARLRVLPGPQDDYFPPAAFEALQTTRFTISSQSDRMGYRLTGNRTIPRIADREMISDATVAGALQVPPSGQPILLMADRQTTGGYPQIAVVITADLPLAAQLVPGEWIEFEICSRADAIAALVSGEERLRSVV